MPAFLLRILREAALVQELETEIKATIVIQNWAVKWFICRSSTNAIPRNSSR
jgi:hypothetical protein